MPQNHVGADLRVGPPEVSDPFAKEKYAPPKESETLVIEMIKIP